MKVSYRTADGGEWTVLFDETAAATGPVLHEFTPSFRGVVQRTPLFKADADEPDPLALEYRAPLGSVTCTMPLTFTVTYASRGEAIAGIRTFAGLLDTRFDLMVEEDDETQFYANAIAESYAAQASGLSILHSFVFITDNVSDESPV